MARQALALAGGVVGAYFGGPVGAQIGFAIGSAIGGYIDPEEMQGPKLGEAPVQSGRDGVAIPVGWGVCHTAGNLIQKTDPWEVETRERSGKGGGGTVQITTRRYMTFAIGIMRSNAGPIVGLQRIWENDKLVYDTRAFPTIEAADTTEFASGIRIYLGTEDQTPDSDLEAFTGVGKTPAYRGLAYCVFIAKDVTEFGSAIPQYRFEVQTTNVDRLTSHIYAVEAIDGTNNVCLFDDGSMTVP